ncbi:TlpA family protein disulfide reductase [Candidatus Nucleicultrix amoebiphila]|jgi:thiol-disulfide isomerase/thioredoxin|uniref:TlpA family protein disulfide reductase n=1 Tax=Candidatus Nucleicultrix amoebiphila TaxID=1509244 RepID=UPI000A26C409|nr:TlpA disulfide reductase family protein [Candidatus Nucleicultrix amoebiphila]
MITKCLTLQTIRYVFVGVFLFYSLPASATPNFTLPLLNQSGHISLSDYRGKVVLIDIWASWCGPCRVSFPLYDQLYKELKSKGFVILAINTDTDLNKAKEFLKATGVSYPILSDPDAQVVSQFNPSTMPYALLLDRQGNIVSTHGGFYEDTFESEIKPKVVELVNK